jgi:hypothetical protein
LVVIHQWLVNVRWSLIIVLQAEISSQIPGICPGSLQTWTLQAVYLLLLIRASLSFKAYQLYIPDPSIFVLASVFTCHSLFGQKGEIGCFFIGTTVSLPGFHGGIRSYYYFYQASISMLAG